MNNTYFKAFVKDNFLVLLGQVILFAKPLLIAPLVIKNISVDAFGAYVLVLSIAGFIIGTAPFGAGFLFRRFAPSEKDLIARGKLFYRQFIFQLLSVSFCFFILLLFSNVIRHMLFSDVPSFSILLLAVYGIFYTVYGQTSNYFRYTARMRKFVYATVAFPYISIAIVLLVYFSGIKLDINTLVLVDVVSLFIVSAFSWVSISSELGFKPSFPELQELKKDISLGFPGVLSYWTDFVLTASSRYLIAFFISLAAVGSFSVALQLGLIATVLPRILGVAVPPLLAKAVDAGDLNNASVMVAYSIKGFLTIAVPFAVMSIFFAKPVLSFYVGRIVSDAAYYIIPLAAVSAIFYGLSNILTCVLSIILKTKDILYANLAASLLNLCINVAGLFYWRSLLVPGLALIAGYAVFFIVLRRKLPEEWHISFNVPYAIKSAISALAASMLGYALLTILISSGFALKFILIPVLLFTLLLHAALIWRFCIISGKEIRYAVDCFKLVGAKFNLAASH